MELNIDMDYLLRCFCRVSAAPSPTGYYPQLNPVIRELAAELGLEVTFDRKNTPYITLEGRDNSRTVMVGAHSDTVGLCVRCPDRDGTLMVRKLGGINMASIEGETVRVHTREGRTYTGLAMCRAHSVHVFPECHTMVRDEDSIRILLDEEVSSPQEVKALGIRNGDFISVDPRVEVTENGYLKARFIDDKGAIACAFAALKAMTEGGQKPAFRTLFAFPHYEEIGMGGTYLPAEAEEYVALDIGLIGPELEGRERAVSIIAKDAVGPYDFELTNRLIRKAQELNIDHGVDACFRYSTDANAALRAGNNIRGAAFGMAVYCSHGRERTHLDGLRGTAKLLLAYLLDL